MKKILTFLFAAFLLGGLNAQDVNVTFQVDMSLETIDFANGGVSVSGDFNGFAKEPMIDQGDGVYAVTLSIPANSTQEYKFRNGDGFEGPSGACAAGSFGNRVLVTLEEDVSLDLVCYSSCSACPGSVVDVDVTFQVDMSQEVIDVANGGVSVSGGFNNFEKLPMIDQGNGIYAVTVTLQSPSTEEYKFRNGDAFESPSGACATGAFGNRVLEVPGENTTLDVVCYSSCEACGDPGEFFDVTFNVDASEITVDPEGIFIAGNFNGFTPTAMNDDGDGTYSITASVEGGSELILWKYLNGSSFDNAESVPEACGQDDGFEGFNRIAPPPSGNVTFETVCFSSCEECPGEVPCENPYPQVTGQSFANINGGVELNWDPIFGSLGCQLQIGLPGGPSQLRTEFGENLSSFFIPGSFLTNGTSYEWRVRCGCSQNPLIGGPWTAYQPFTYINFGISEEPGTTLTAVPNPSNGYTFISLNTTTDSDQALVEVYDLSGRLVERVFQGNVAADQEMRFEFDGTHLTEGIYLIRYTTNNEVVTEKMMISK